MDDPSHLVMIHHHQRRSGINPIPQWRLHWYKNLCDNYYNVLGLFMSFHFMGQTLEQCQGREQGFAWPGVLPLEACRSATHASILFYLLLDNTLGNSARKDVPHCLSACRSMLPRPHRVSSSPSSIHPGLCSGKYPTAQIVKDWCY